MAQQQTPKQLAQTFPVMTTASILTTSNAPMNSPEVGPSSSASVQSTTIATIPSSSGSTAGNLTNKNDPKMVEQSVAKLKQFLKNLVKLTEGRSKKVQDQVQLHVQRLLAGTMSEEQFAENLEKDLNSQHQPTLLPFLKSSVPQLRATLRQQRLMIEKQQLEKQKSTQASAAGLNNAKPANQVSAIVATAATSATALTMTPANTTPTAMLRANSSPSGKFLDSKLKVTPLTRGKTKKDFSSFGNGHSDDDGEEDMEVANLPHQEEAVHFLPPSVTEADTSDKKIEDVPLLDGGLLRHKILAVGYRSALTTTSSTGCQVLDS